MATKTVQSIIPEHNTPWTLGATKNVSTAALTASNRLGVSAGNVSSMSTRIGMRVQESPSPHPPESTPMPTDGFTASKYQARLLNSQSAEGVEVLLAASCAVMCFDIAEIWLRTGPKTHQLINSHLRSTSLDETLRDQLVEVYYGDSAAERTHRLSPALCKKAKEDNDVVWVTAQTESGARALKCSLNGVLTAVAVPICHEATNSNLTVIYFSVKRATMRPEAIEFLVHSSIAAAVAGVNNFAEDSEPSKPSEMSMLFDFGKAGPPRSSKTSDFMSQHPHTYQLNADQTHEVIDTSRGVRPIPSDDRSVLSLQSVTGAKLNLHWSDLRNVEYLTDGGNNWIHTAVMKNKSVVVKQLKPEVKDVAVAINEIEGELKIHSLLDHNNIVALFGAGFTADKSRFLILERLDGGTITQQLGYDTRIRDRRRRFWKKQKMPYIRVLEVAEEIAQAMDYCHRLAIPGSMVLHRDLKPDNIGFSLGGAVKIIDFGLARIVDNMSPDCDEVHEMSGETGSLRYMAPEVASSMAYNQKADVYSFGIILWELLAYEKPFDGMNREEFYEKVVHGGYRPEMSKKFPQDVATLMRNCWSPDIETRPNFNKVVELLNEMILKEKGGHGEKKKGLSFFKRDPEKEKDRKLADRHSTWF